MRLLFAAELPKTAILPPRENFADAALHCIAVKEVVRRHRRAVTLQALEKQRARESIWPRCRVGLLIAAPITLPIFMLVPTVWASGMLANHQMWEWFALNFCAYRIEDWFSRRPNSCRSPPGRVKLAGYHGPSPCDERGSPYVVEACLARHGDLPSDFSDENIDALFAEVIRRRTRWRVVHYARLAFIVALVVLTLWLTPYAVLHRSPLG
jgi:hypothetical protein